MTLDGESGIIANEVDVLRCGDGNKIIFDHVRYIIIFRLSMERCSRGFQFRSFSLVSSIRQPGAVAWSVACPLPKQAAVLLSFFASGTFFCGKIISLFP